MKIIDERFFDPNLVNLVDMVSVKEPVVFNKSGLIKIIAVDFGLKYNQIRLLCNLNACVTVVPWNYDLNIDGNEQ